MKFLIWRQHKNRTQMSWKVLKDTMERKKCHPPIYISCIMVWRVLKDTNKSTNVMHTTFTWILRLLFLSIDQPIWKSQDRTLTTNTRPGQEHWWKTSTKQAATPVMSAEQTVAQLHLWLKKHKHKATETSLTNNSPATASEVAAVTQIHRRRAEMNSRCIDFM